MSMKTPAGTAFIGTLIFYFTLNLLGNKEITIIFFHNRDELLLLDFKFRSRNSEIKSNMQTIAIFKHYFLREFHAKLTRS